MLTVIHLLQDTDIGGESFRAGEFLEVDKRVAKQLLDDNLAEEKTEEKVRQEAADEIEAAKRKTALDQRDNEMSHIKVIGERVRKDPQGGYGYFAEFLRDVAIACKPRGMESQRLQSWNRATKVIHDGSHIVEYDDSQGGYLIPPEYATRIHNVELQAASIRPRAFFMPMGTNRLAINAVVDEDHSTNLFGGITFYRTGEAHQKSSSKPTFRQIELTLHKLTGLTSVSDEMIEDSPQSIEALLTTLFGQALAWQEDDDFINGTGINMPWGIHAANCIIPVAATPAQPANTVTAANIVNMWCRLHPPSMNNANWLCYQDVLPQLYQMGISVGTGGSVVFTPAGGLSSSPYAALMGRPLIPTEHCQALGTQGDIILVDLSQYVIGGKSAGGAPNITSSIHIYFDYDLVAFRIVSRYDGQCLWRVALTPANGNTLSPIVELVTRP